MPSYRKKLKNIHLRNVASNIEQSRIVAKLKTLINHPGPKHCYGLAKSGFKLNHMIMTYESKMMKHDFCNHNPPIGQIVTISDFEPTFTHYPLFFFTLGLKQTTAASLLQVFHSTSFKGVKIFEEENSHPTL